MYFERYSENTEKKACSNNLLPFNLSQEMNMVLYFRANDLFETVDKRIRIPHVL